MSSMTKKMPVSVSYGDSEATAHEFLVPAMDAGFGGFRGLKSGRLYPYGALSYLGKAITVNDVFAKLVDCGQKIDSVDGTLKMLDAYLQMLQEYRIGNVLTVESSPDACGFKLRKVAERPSTTARKLP